MIQRFAIHRPYRHFVLAVVMGVLSLSATAAPAGDLELAVSVGRALPFYKQSFGFEPGDVVPPGIPVETSGGFDLELDGGLAFSGALTWRFNDVLGLEARVDTAKVNLEVTGGTVTGDIGNLIPGLPSIPVSGELSGDSKVDNLTPFSLNLQLGFGDRTRFVISGGASYMPATTLAATVGVELGLENIPGISLPAIGVSAAATLDGGFGFNLGAGLRVPLSDNVSLVFDARGFGFPEQELRWGSGSGASPIEDLLAEALDPIRFKYGFFQATGGVAFTF
jgi:opacity protein-like surface antigen